MKLQIAVPQHGAGKKAAFEQDLKPVADAEDRPAATRKLRDRGHHRRESSNRTGAQVVAVRKATGKDDHVGPAQGHVLVPHERRVGAQHVPSRVIRVVIAIGTGKDDDGKFHFFLCPGRT